MGPQGPPGEGGPAGPPGPPGQPGFPGLRVRLLLVPQTRAPRGRGGPGRVWPSARQGCTPCGMRTVLRDASVSHAWAALCSSESPTPRLCGHLRGAGVTGGGVRARGHATPVHAGGRGCGLVLGAGRTSPGGDPGPGPRVGAGRSRRASAPSPGHIGNGTTLRARRGEGRESGCGKDRARQTWSVWFLSGSQSRSSRGDE